MSAWASSLEPVVMGILAGPIIRALLVVGLGLVLGNVRFPGGFKLGVAGVLFAGLLLGALLPGFTIPPVLQDLGLILFVYGIGLQTGPGFFRSFRSDGLRLNGAVLGALFVAFSICCLLIHWAHQRPETMAGLFCGALTNTPALGAATEAVGRRVHDAGSAGAVVIGYGIAYPFAIFVVLSLIQYLVSRDQGKSAESSVNGAMEARTVRVTAQNGSAPLTKLSLESLFRIRVTRGRARNKRAVLLTSESELSPGMLVTVVGAPLDVEGAVGRIGEPSAVSLPAMPSDLEVSDLRVSNRAICGRSIREIEGMCRGIVISRLRRGDLEMAATPELHLEPGDEVRVVADRDQLEALPGFFGNSVAAISETSYLTFVIGILLGLLVGQIPIPVPGLAAPLHLGLAGGPLLAGLVLGRLDRTGPILWTMPYGLNLGIRNFGILFFLAAVGANAGSQLPAALETQGVALIAFAVMIASVAHLVAWSMMKLMGERSLPTVLGALAGLQTQPAALSFAADRVSPEKVQVGYASVYPLATIGKIILAQLLLGLH